MRAVWVLVVFAGLSVLGTGLASVFTGWLTPRQLVDLDDPLVMLLTSQVLAGSALATVVCHLGFREPVGLGLDGWARSAAGGFALGGLMLTLAVVVPALVGATGLAWSSLPAGALLRHGGSQLLFLGPAAIGEELLLRGLALRVLARGTRPWIAVALTGSVFGVLHLGNPNASLVAALDIALVGLLFGAVALRGGTLWAPMGLHLSWNFFEGFVYGQPVSGLQPATSLFRGSWSQGHSFWSGGDFGPEAAGWTAVLLVVATAVVAFSGRPRV